MDRLRTVRWSNYNHPSQGQKGKIRYHEKSRSSLCIYEYAKFPELDQVLNEYEGYLFACNTCCNSSMIKLVKWGDCDDLWIFECEDDVSFWHLRNNHSNYAVVTKRGTGAYLTRSNDNIPYTNGKPKQQSDNTKTPPNCSITQRLRSDIWQSLGVTTAIQLVRLNQLTGSQPSH